MSKYTPRKMMIANSTDIHSFYKSMDRMAHEDLADFRDRVVLETIDSADPGLDSYVKTPGRVLGELDQKILEIDLILDANGDPLATDPVIEVTANEFRAYSDYANETMDIQLLFTNASNGRWLKDIKTALDASSLFNVTTAIDYDDYLESKKLRYGNNLRYVAGRLFRGTKSHALGNKYIRSIIPKMKGLLQKEKSSKAAISEDGDYWVDYTNGVVFTNDSGYGFSDYQYAEFPFSVFWQPIKSWPLFDDNKERIMYNAIKDDNGNDSYVELGSRGARLINDVLSVHPLNWS